MEKKKKKYLSDALDRTFLNTERLGFWDEKNSRINSMLLYDKNWNWEISADNSDRYGVFTITMILLSKLVNELNISKYESKIISYLNYNKSYWRF